MITWLGHFWVGEGELETICVNFCHFKEGRSAEDVRNDLAETLKLDCPT
jgi:hypothetical protein